MHFSFIDIDPVTPDDPQSWSQILLSMIENPFSLHVFQNQAQVATSLQVFHNLGSLREIVDKVVDQCKDNLEKDIRACLDVTSLSVQNTSTHGKGEKCSLRMIGLIRGSGGSQNCAWFSTDITFATCLCMFTPGLMG